MLYRTAVKRTFENCLKGTYIPLKDICYSRAEGGTKTIESAPCSRHKATTTISRIALVFMCKHPHRAICYSLVCLASKTNYGLNVTCSWEHIKRGYGRGNFVFLAKRFKVACEGVGIARDINYFLG